jgi:hypothetical protein
LPPSVTTACRLLASVHARSRLRARDRGAGVLGSWARDDVSQHVRRDRSIVGPLRNSSADSGYARRDLSSLDDAVTKLPPGPALSASDRRWPFRDFGSDGGRSEVPSLLHHDALKAWTEARGERRRSLPPRTFGTDLWVSPPRSQSRKRPIGGGGVWNGIPGVLGSCGPSGRRVASRPSAEGAWCWRS